MNKEKNMRIVIREAVKADGQRMMELIHELALYEKAPEQVTVSYDHFIESGFGAQPVWWAYVAETIDAMGNSVLVGFALYYIRYSTWKGQRLYLEDLIVTASMRGKGIGKLLFDQLLQVCAQKKMSGMAWQVLDWNEPALHFYKKYEGVQFDLGWINASINCATDS